MAYQPIPGAGVSVSATAASVSGTLPAAGVAASMVYVYNAGSVPIAFRTGKGAQTALLTDQILGPGQGMFVAKGQGADGVAAIGTAAGPSTVYFCGCDGNTY